MIAETIPAELRIDTNGACVIALECWRLSLTAELLKDGSYGAGLRHAVRRITETLKAMGVECVDFAGRQYDPGMVPEVVEVRIDKRMSDGNAIVAETVAPTVTWRGQVVKPGQIIVVRAPVITDEETTVSE